MKYRGSCHCGKVAFDVEGDIGGVISCNCSICSRKGSILWFVARPQMTLLTDDRDLADYQFNRHNIHHRFCKTCGIQPFGHGTGPDGTEMAAINLRCIEGLDLDTIQVTPFDGRAL
jgi:hypothetical protein